MNWPSITHEFHKDDCSERTFHRCSRTAVLTMRSRVVKKEHGMHVKREVPVCLSIEGHQHTYLDSTRLGLSHQA